MSEHLTKLKMIVKLNGWQDCYKEILTMQQSCKIAVNNNRHMWAYHLIERHELGCRHCASYQVFREARARDNSVVEGAVKLLTDLQENQ